MQAVVITVLAIALVATYTTWLAARLDRLQARCDAAWSALEVQLVRRAVAAEELAAQLGDGAELHERARAALAEPTDAQARERAENDLTRELRAVLDSLPDGDPRAAPIDTASGRVGMARQFHNDAVREVRSFRRRRAVRLFRLGRAQQLPEYFEIDAGQV